MSRTQIIKKAIAVFDPDDAWEKSIQDASKAETGNWLPSFPCKLLAKAIASLRIGDDWLDNDDLLPVRAHYLFAPYLIDNKETLIFVTHLIYLRDILENMEINANLNNPIIFMTPPIANFLFRNSPVHISINVDLLRKQNPKAEFVDVGGFLICDKGNIELDYKMITGVHYYGSEHNRNKVYDIIYNVQPHELSKAAAQEIAHDVFKIDEHFPELLPDDKVWDKITRSEAKVTQIEASENGLVWLRYFDGKEITIPKQEFDIQFTVTS